MPYAPTADDSAAYQALCARDARFDGRLFVGVTSTGVYCRPVCRVRTPRLTHCRFFGHAAAAEAAGFRPCLRCRPERAPGRTWSTADATQALAAQAAPLLQAAAHDGEPQPVARVARRLGVTDRHLRRLFTAAHGVTPIDYLLTTRLLMAKQLLADTDLGVAQVALAAGFGDGRRLHEALARRYRLSPSDLRRGHGGAGPAGGTALTLRLGFRPPLDAAGLLRFLGARALPGVEGVTADGQWRRTLRLPAPDGQGAIDGWLSARFDVERHELVLDAAPAFAPVLGRLVRRVRQALDLDADPEPIDVALAALPFAPVPGLRLPGSADGFETAVRIVLGQQISVAAARTLALRLVARFGTPVATPFAELDRAFPTPAVLAAADADDLGRLGIVRQRVAALQALARAVADGSLVLDAGGADLDTTLAALLALPGIGPWTAQLIALRVLGWPDAWPASDLGLLRAFGVTTAAAATEAVQACRPWRSYAVIRAWQALDHRTAT
ncbi:Ada metal-binding domain-containing protein [Aquabacterium sp. J223]|uniref:Ada metal-binding domain-containing protein n=1 Tax=Aquabacterium sp. J223 TaxID=2898431 RepID=UPI0021AD78A7|nr:Ada metal-binding domain-containing protein [Aquabacterium sp. J223]UUX97158.1 helix-turn-helix domain-containing protein [Aquabacterium sp. J223]